MKARKGAPRKPQTGLAMPQTGLAMHSAASPDWGTPMLLRRFAARVLAPAAFGPAIDLDYASSAYWQDWWPNPAERPTAFLDGSKGRDVLVADDRFDAVAVARARFKNQDSTLRIGSGFLNAPGLGGGEMVQKCWEVFEKDHREAKLGSGLWVGYSIETFGSLQNVGERNPLTCAAEDLITTIVPSRRAHYLVSPEQLIALTQRKMAKRDRKSKQWLKEKRLIEKLRARTDEAPVDAGAPTHLSYVSILWSHDQGVRRRQMEAARQFFKAHAEDKSLFQRFEVIGALA